MIDPSNLESQCFHILPVITENLKKQSLEEAKRLEILNGP